MEVAQLYLLVPFASLQAAPTLLDALPFVPFAFAVISLLLAISERLLPRYRRSHQSSDEPSYFSVFIQESDVIAGLQADEHEQETELTPDTLEALLPPPPLALLVIPLLEGVIRIALLIWRLVGNGGRTDFEMFGEVALAAAWVYAFFAEALSRSRLPPWSHLVLFLLLLTNAAVDFAKVWHSLVRDPTFELSIFLSSIPDVPACTFLVLAIIRMPLRAPIGAVLRDQARDVRQHPQSPEDTVSLLGSLTYSWMNPIMAIARQRPLLPSDVWSLSLNNRTEVLARRFAQLQEETLVGKILHASARDISFDFALKLIAVTFNYLRPYWIQRILEALTLASATLASATSTADSPPSWSPRDQAYIFALFAFLSMAGKSLVELQHYHIARRVGMRLRSELTVAVYEKALSRKDLAGEVHRPAASSTTEKKKEDEKGSASVGKVVSLISDDTNRVLRMGCDAHLIYGAPLEIILALTFLYTLMGWSALVGFGILVVASPLSYKLGQRSLGLSIKRSAARDCRQASLQELITAIRTVKFFGWSTAWTEKVDTIRQEELSSMIREWINQYLVMLLFMLISVVVPLVSFACYVKLQGEDLTVAVAFTSLSYFAMVRGPLNQIPDFGIRLLQTKISIARIESFFAEEEVASHATPLQRSSSSKTLSVNDATFRYSKTEEGAFEFADISIPFPEGQLTLVSGPTGSGKTSLLLALLGELEVLSGSVDLPATVSYAAQHPWLESSSIRESILFGAPYDPTRYFSVLEACALQPDLALLPDSDSTLIGERGVSLSGGQRTRVALARAIYAHTSVILLDDVLSAVDAQTGRHLFTKALTGPLVKGRTVVLCTHHTSLVLPGVSYHVELEEGRIVSQGPVERSKVDESALEQVEEACNAEEEVPKEGAEAEEEERVKPSIAAETWTMGAVHRSIYVTYLSSAGWLLCAMHLLFVVARPVVGFAEQFWLRRWGESLSQVRVDYFLVGYGIISLASVLIFLLAMLALYALSLRAMRTIFKRLLRSIVNAPPRWFDITPVGRITNRFTNDVSILDGELAANFSNFAGCLLSMALNLGVGTFILPSAIGPTIAFGVIYFFTFTRYLGVSRDLNRIAATTASPLFSGFQQVLVGITTIRAFSRERDYRSHVCTVLDETLGIWYASCTLDVWLSIRTQLLSGATLLSTSILAIHSHVSPGLAGIAISSSLFIISFLDALCSSYGRLVNSLNSLERITEYLELPQEPEGGEQPPASWPSSACKGPLVEVKDLEIRYSPELEPALKGVSFQVRPGERVAIAGRTGSGKSTLAMSLLRFVDPSKGSIILDGLDITTLNLTSLRSRITFLPQDAVLFSGTLRSNLDPFAEHSDLTLLRALERTHLLPPPSASGSSTPASTIAPSISLDTVVAAGGNNFSAGQKQLISLARALLRDSRLIIMDESTASLDPSLDARVQQTIREEFPSAALITIAHRLRTIIDYSRVLVIDQGRVEEFDTPRALLEKGEGGYFVRMCRESGDWEELKGKVGI